MKEILDLRLAALSQLENMQEVLEKQPNILRPTWVDVYTDFYFSHISFNLKTEAEKPGSMSIHDKIRIVIK